MPANDELMRAMVYEGVNGVSDMEAHENVHSSIYNKS